MRQIASIQSLRAFAALIVVIGHAQTEALVAAAKQGSGFAPLSLLPWGAGVDLFFVISGFIMVVASGRLFATPGGAGTFATRRLKRIVPLYWLFTTLYVLIQFATHKPVDGGSLAASYLFWPHDTYGDGVLRPIFALGWTLNYEMFFYALFSLAVLLPCRRAVALVASLLVVGVAVGRVVPLPTGPLAFWTQPIVLEFALGMGLGLAWREGVRLGGGPRVVLALAGLLCLGYDTMGSSHQASTWITPTDLWRLAGWGLPAAALLASAALARKPATSGLLGTVALGDASYALYLVHPFIVGTMVRGLDAGGHGASGRLLAVCDHQPCRLHRGRARRASLVRAAAGPRSRVASDRRPTDGQCGGRAVIRSALEAVRSGCWLTAERLRVYPIMVGRPSRHRPRRSGGDIAWRQGPLGQPSRHGFRRRVGGRARGPGRSSGGALRQRRACGRPVGGLRTVGRIPHLALSSLFSRSGGARGLRPVSRRVGDLAGYDVGRLRRDGRQSRAGLRRG